MLTVKYCCCGCTLETGTKIIIYTCVLVLTPLCYRALKTSYKIDWKTVVDEIFLRACLDALLYLSIGMIPLVASISISLKRPVFLIPFLGTQVLLMGVGIFTMIALAFGNRTVLFHLGALPSLENTKDKLVLFIIISEILILLLESLNFYCFIVLLSYYKELKRGSGIDTGQGRRT